MYWIYLATFVLGGMALDWAFFDRMRNQVDMFWPIKDGFGYRDLLFPRAFVSVFAAVVVGVGALETPPHTWLIILGGNLFLLSHFYTHYKIWRSGRRRQAPASYVRFPPIAVIKGPTISTRR